jgi:DNA topoisomerase-3
VIGKAADVAFKTTGKVIYKRMAHCFLRIPTQRKKRIYYDFIKGEKATPTLVLEKETKAQISSQGDLITAMETAGKQVDDEDLRELMKRKWYWTSVNTSEYY